MHRAVGLAQDSEKTDTGEGLAGLVERVTYHNAENGFCVLRARARGHRDVVTVVGHAAAISAGEWIIASGHWVNDRNPGHDKKLVRAFGEKVFDIIETTPDRLREARRDYRPWAQ